MEVDYYRYAIYECKQRAREAVAFNSLVQSEPKMRRLGREVEHNTPAQQGMEI